MSDSAIDKYYLEHPPKPNFSYYNFAGKKYFYAFAGDSTKPMLFLVHGAPGAWFGYKEFLSDSTLLNHFQLVVPDRAGYNKSDKNVISVSEQAKIIKEIIHLRKPKSVVLFGRSYGAGIVARVAAEYPELIKEVILVSPACDPSTEKFWWFSKPVNTRFVRFFLPSYINAASNEKFSHVAELKQLTVLWEKISCPVTILQGGKDWVIDTNNGQFVNDALKNAPRRLIYLPENGHLLTHERFELVKSVLLEAEISSLK